MSAPTIFSIPSSAVQPSPISAVIAWRTELGICCSFSFSVQTKVPSSRTSRLLFLSASNLSSNQITSFEAERSSKGRTASLGPEHESACTRIYDAATQLRAKSTLAGSEVVFSLPPHVHSLQD